MLELVSAHEIGLEAMLSARDVGAMSSKVTQLKKVQGRDKAEAVNQEQFFRLHRMKPLELMSLSTVNVFEVWSSYRSDLQRVVVTVTVTNKPQTR